MSPEVPEPIRLALEGLPRRGHWLAGISGGADSMALAAALAACGFRRVTLCHFSHGLRPQDASREAGLVRRAARQFGFAFEHGRGDTASRTRGLGLEAAARSLRLAFFEECARRRRCRRILLAHHLEDQAETVLMALCRGTGLAGLGGMARQTRIGGLTVVRPF
ncbi:MAG: tRNA lysidine(34) synthetase TilS, partial [Terrimicrobiaceae bacterium]|nr:tRNA lysidine(34) synthetase TilS [Terrimicrobiaceae bacterium]